MSETQVASTDPFFTPKLNAALSKAQGVFTVPIKNREVDVKNKEGKFLYKFKYADLAAVHEATRVGCKENGLSHTHIFRPALNGGHHEVLTFLRHDSGEMLMSTLPFRIDDPKQTASMITYWRRYALSALLGVSADEDTDGGVDDNKEASFKDKAPPKAQGPSPISPAPKPQAAPKPAPKPQQEEGPDFGPYDPTEGGDLPELSLLDQLLVLVQEKSIHPDDMKKHIARVVGREVRAKDLDHDELTRVVHFIANFVNTKKN